jgi:EspG family
VLDRPAAVKVDALARIMRATGTGEPHFVLTEGASWHDPGTDRAADDDAWRLFARAGLAEGRALRPGAADALAVLAHPSVEFYGWITEGDATTAVLAAATGPEAVVAVRKGGGVHLRSGDADRLPDALLAQLPPVRAGRGRAVSVPRARLVAELGGGERGYLVGTRSAPADVTPFARLAALPRTGAGELHVAVRAPSGRRTEAPHAIGYQDTAVGRWLVQVVPGHDDEWVTAVPATPGLLLDRLREARRGLP